MISFKLSRSSTNRSCATEHRMPQMLSRWTKGDFSAAGSRADGGRWGGFGGREWPPHRAQTCHLVGRRCNVSEERLIRAGELGEERWPARRQEMKSRGPGEASRGVGVGGGGRSRGPAVAAAGFPCVNRTRRRTCSVSRDKTGRDSYGPPVDFQLFY